MGFKECEWLPPIQLSHWVKVSMVHLWRDDALWVCWDVISWGSTCRSFSPHGSSFQLGRPFLGPGNNGKPLLEHLQSKSKVEDHNSLLMTDVFVPFARLTGDHGL